MGQKTPFFRRFLVSAYRQTWPNIRYRIFGRFWPNIRPNIRYSVVHYKFHSLSNILLNLQQLINQSNIGNPNQSLNEEVRRMSWGPNLIDSDSPRYQRYLLSLSPGLDDVPDYIGNDVSYICLQN